MMRWVPCCIVVIGACAAASGCRRDLPAMQAETTAAASSDPRTKDASPPSDATLAGALRMRIDDDGLFHDAPLAVSASRGVVTLSGNVPSLYKRERALALAGTFRGVRSVVDRIVVLPPKRADEAITSDLRRALAIVPGLREVELEVTVTDARIRIEGEVASWVERERLADLAASVRGARAVVNAVSVAPRSTRSDRAIAADVDYRLGGDVWLAGTIHPAVVRDGRVALAGVVGSLADKHRAVALAWVAGARAVDDDRLRVDELLFRQSWRRERLAPETAAVTRETIARAFALDGRLAPGPFRLDVAVDRGVATISGTVPRGAQRIAAGEDAASAIGVVRVVNEIVVEPKEIRSDADLARDVREALARSPAFDDAIALRVTSTSGVVKLAGAVPSLADREELEKIAWQVDGVRRVDDAIALSRAEAASPAEIRRRILHAMAWDPHVDPTTIGVVVTPEHRVVLTGTALDPTEIRAAIDHAIAMSGGPVESRIELR